MKRKINKNWLRSDTVVRIRRQGQSVIINIFHMFKTLSRSIQYIKMTKSSF